MIRRVLDSRLPLMVYPPLRVFDLDYFRAVHEAGGLPVLDTEFFQDSKIHEYIKQLDKAGVLFGVRLSVSDIELYEWIEKNAPDFLDALVFYSVFSGEMENFKIKSRTFKVILEISDININRIIDRISPDAVILKGYEGGGRISGYTGYVLMQWYLHNTDYPVFIHGGVGMHNSAGMFSAGVSGVVLDSQLYLAEESPVADNFRQLFETIEESDTVIVEGPSKTKFRFFAKLGTAIVHDLKKKETHFALSDQKNDDESKAFFELIQKNTTPLNNDSARAVQSLFYLGQDSVFAKVFASKGRTVREIIKAFFRNINEHIADIEKHDPVKADTELAREHGTRYPVIQGPMANISESAEFAKRLHEEGGLPFFAMGNLPQHIATEVIEKAEESKVPYGAGLIGIEVFNRSLPGHLDLVKKYRSPFALFAGGTPFQVADLEKAGTKTYLHTPSSMMLENAIQNGCTRYIFEGTEAGGHVGSLGSLVLWELAVERISRMKEPEARGRTLVFAGGISTPAGSHFISGLSSFLAKRGVKIALQVGSAYLFTREMIETGSITPRYQKEILERKSTLVIGRTVGLPSRTLESPFSLKMLDHEYERISGGMPLVERKKAFEHDNMGSLLIGAKGFVPDFKNDPSKYIWFNEEEVYEKGNFCVGDSLAFFDELTTIREIHETYFCTKELLAKNLDRLEIITRPDHEIHDEIAVTGIGCVFPDAFSPEELWQNVINKKNSIRKVPDSRLDSSLYFDTDRHREATSYTQIGGVIENFAFDGKPFGFTDEQAAKISRSQQLILIAAKQAVESACKNGKQLPSNSAVIIASCLGNELTNDLQLKYYTTEILSEIEKLPEYQALDDDAKAALESSLKTGLANNHSNEPPDTAVLNIEASRVAAAFSLEGPNYVVDAACATSFAAIDCAIRELLSGSCDAAVTGGLNTNLTPEAFIGFCKMGALSAEGSWPFDARANGFVLGEGAGCFVLKRMRDALRDGDEIYGIIKGMGGSSDGKGKAIAAPNPAGQELALRRCFETAKTAISPDDVDYIEAHGTSTIMGDAAEIETIRKVYGSSSVGISSVKSQIGHLLGGAGSAGLVKALMALRNKTLPPNGDFRELSSAHDIKNTGIYIIEDAESWDVPSGKSRRAAISSYGFGGINYHCVVEEFTENYTVIERNVFPDIEWNPNDDRIVVAGLGAVLPEALNIEEFWERLVEGKSVISENPDLRFNMKAYSEEKDKEYRLPEVKAGVVKNFRFNNVRYRIPPMSASSVDRSQLFALTAADEAVTSSGLSKALDFGNRVSVILGTISGTHYVENVLKVRIPFIQRVIRNTEGLPADAAERISGGLAEILGKRLPRLTEDTTPGLLSNIVSGRIANFFGCNGANFIIDAACASSALAIRAAIFNLLSRKSDFVITGGVDTNFYPTAMLVFKRLGLLSEKGTHVFDENGTGVNLSEGAAIQVLTTYRKAKELGMPVLAEIRSLEMQSKAGDNMFSPSAPLFCKVIEEAHKKAGSCRDEIDHLDVFGFGHYLLDQIEYRAARTMFEKNTVFGNIKPEFGYFKAANPAVVLTRMILMNMHRTALPFNSFNPETSMTRTDSHLTAGTSKRHIDRKRPVFAADIFGFGGNHGHLVTGAVPAWMQEKQDAVSKIADFEITETSFIYTDRYEGKKGLAVLLSGQGAQYRGMLKELYMSEPEIHEIMYRAEGIFKAERGHSLLEMMFEGTGGDINSTENTQPSVFTASAAIYRELVRQGLEADAFIGHSVGEYTALYTSGMLDFDTAFRLVLKRSALMKKAADETAGEIMAVFKGSEEVELLIKGSGIRNVYVANKNSRKQTVVSGTKAGIGEFSILLTTKGILYRKLNLSGAFHTPLFKSAADGLAEEIRKLSFNMGGHAKVISNVTGRPYPDNPEEIKNLLIAQIVSPVEFIKSVEHLYRAGIRNFVEAGSGKILTNLVKDMGFEDIFCTALIDSRTEETASFRNAVSELERAGFINQGYSSLAMSPSVYGTGAKVIPVTRKTAIGNKNIGNTPESEKYSEEDFNNFINENKELVRERLYSEYVSKKRDERLDAYDQFGFYTGTVSIAGVSVGLPGTARHVFESDNFDRLLSGQNFIESLTEIEKEKMLDKNITRLVKESDGNARFKEISSPDDVIQLAGKLGFFDLEKEYGIAEKYDITIGLSIAAGIEALKDAGIPLVMHYRETASGGRIPEGLALPSEMQNTTGVILTTLFPGWDTLIDEVREYYHQKFFVKPYQEMEKIYYFLMENLSDSSIKSKITEWFFGVWNKQAKGNEKYAFKRDFPANITPLGSAHFARIIKAKGPNIQMSGACASTTQAVCVAEDWIRTGRCERVIIIGGEAATSRNQSPWIGSGFLVLGAASTKKSVHEAAKPFDVDRNGTILGAGATSLIVERSDRIMERGLKGQAEILGTKIGNSAFHTTGIDVKHLSQEMAEFIGRVEKRHNLDKSEYAEKTVFMSHETYTPARGGSADAEIEALRASYGKLSQNITITNTKGYTGHTLGAAIEDAVMVKALQTGKVPPVANLKKIPENFADLKFSKGENSDFEYGLHLSAGFGSHFALLFVRKTNEKPLQGNIAYNEWLKKISGSDNPVLKEINKTLCIEGVPLKPDSAKTIEKQTPIKARIKEPVQPEAEKEVKPEVKQNNGSENRKEKIRAIIAEQTGYSEDMLEYNLDLEADLGIDTVKQVEIFGRITAAFGVEIPEGANLRELNTIGSIAEFMGTLTGEQITESHVSSEQSGTVRNSIRKIISDQTGYSEDMLEYNLDLEADLGIDTVKQVEIFGKITAAFGVEIPEGANLRELNTIDSIAEFMATLMPESSSPDADIDTETEKIDETATMQAYSSITAEKIIKIISDQTGYSTEMIGFENDLEADLGIDTIKQVDIFGNIMNHFEMDFSDETGLRNLKSVAEIASFVDRNRESGKRLSGKTGSGFPMAKLPSFMSPESIIHRFEVTVRETDLPVSPDFDIKGRTILVSLDNIGLHTHVIRMLKNRGANIITAGIHPDADITADFTNPENISAEFGKLSKRNPEISGFVHLFPVSSQNAGNHENDLQPLSLFNAVKALCGNPAKPLALIAMPAFSSVIFPYINPEICPDPECAGLSGFLKTAARELPETRVKVVDFGEKRDRAYSETYLESVAGRFVKEILSEDKRVETGYINDRKYVPSLRPEKAASGNNLLENCKAVLVTGGAGGITFEIVKSIAENRKSTRFILTGRSNISELDGELANAKQSELLKILKARMPGEKPVTVKKAVERIKRIKNTAENIKALKKAGADVIYYPADVTDISAVRKIAEKHAEIDGIIHAAGVEESQFIFKKTPESFARVFDTKIKGFRNISKAFENHDLKFMMAFSSVTARFGNAGQCDYTAANDMLGKMLFSEKSKRPDLVVKVMSWTAWEGTGMATDETVRKVLESRGLTFLPLEDGIRFFNAEISNDISGESVFSGLDRSFDPDGLLDDMNESHDENHERENYFLDRLTGENDPEYTFTRYLDPENDLFLHDHSMAGTPIFLGATGIETMAEAASAVAGDGLELRTMRDFAIPYGIKLLRNMPKDIEITAKKTGNRLAGCRITSRFAGPKGEVLKEHYKGTFVFSDMASEPEFTEIPDLPEISFEGQLDSIIYHPSRLFMEGVFKTIESIEGFDGNTLVTVVSDNSEKPFFTGEYAPDFLTPVVLVDAMFQTGGLLNMMTNDELVLPFGINRMQFLEKPERHEEYLCITRKTGSTRKTDIFDLVLADSTGRVFIKIEGFEMVKIGKLDSRLSISDRFSSRERKAS